ncbi:hypothetical protein [Inconstantimicrobium porci]|nr:hypothetical protein [Inconstantimicrobium porci]MDD6771009.1 hypothetical protein [Inconstantimicrobium porci]
MLISIPQIFIMQETIKKSMVIADEESDTIVPALLPISIVHLIIKKR